MCITCWEKYGSPRIVNERTTRALEAVAEVYEDSGAGGNLHIVLDDFNIEDHSIIWCLQKNDLTPAEAICAKLFLELSIEERASVLGMEY